MAELNKHSKLITVKRHIVNPIQIDLDIPSNNKTYNELIKQVDLNRWYYTDKKIEYVHNKYGYRADELTTIDDSDYLLTFGCSYSYGTGLFYEDTYSHKLSQELNLKNINLAIPGSSLQIQQYNTTLFLNNFIEERLPKYVIYQYPHDYRVTLGEWDTGNYYLDLQTQTANDDSYGKNEYIKRYYLENSGQKFLQDYLTPLYLNNVWELLGVPVFHITFGDYIQEYKSVHQKFKIINIREKRIPHDEYLYYLARDLSHSGRDFHNDVYNTLLNKINNG